MVDHSELVRIISVIRDYSPYGRDFRGEEEKYVHSAPHDFEIADLYIDCY